MLSQQDINLIESMMVRVVGTALCENNAEMKAYIDERFEQNNAEMKNFVREHVKEEIKESESFLLDEIERFYNFTKRDIQKLTAKVEEIAEYYRISRNEQNQYNYVISLYHKQQQEINEIKQVLAM